MSYLYFSVSGRPLLTKDQKALFTDRRGLVVADGVLKNVNDRATLVKAILEVPSGLTSPEGWRPVVLHSKC